MRGLVETLQVGASVKVDYLGTDETSHIGGDHGCTDEGRQVHNQTA